MTRFAIAPLVAVLFAFPAATRGADLKDWTSYNGGAEG